MSTSSPSPTPAELRRTERLQAARAAHTRRYELVADHAGSTLRNLVKTMMKKATFTTWEEALDEFARGVEVRVRCGGVNPDRSHYSRWQNHTVRFNPDGSVDLLSHPDYEINVDAELMMAGFGGEMCLCVAAGVYVPTRIQANLRLGRSTLLKNLRALHAMIQWAQEPEVFWSPEFGESVLPHGITPALLHDWEARGWEREAALRFLQMYAPPATADVWLADGKTGTHDAAAAARGEVPDEDARWLVVGFTVAKAARWRKAGFSPEEAWEWEAHRIPPKTVADVKRRTRPGPRHVPLDMTKEWTKAGVYATEVFAWMQVTNSNLDLAVKWCRNKMHSWDFSAIQNWNRRYPERAVTAEQVHAFTAVGIRASDPESISLAVATGVTPDQFKEAVRTVPLPEGAMMRDFLGNERLDRPEWQRDFSVNGIGYQQLKRGAPDLTRAVVRLLAEEPTR